MVADGRKIERHAGRRCGSPARKSLRVGLLLGVAAALGACVSQGGPSKEEARLHQLLAASPQSEPKSGPDEQATSSGDGYHLHLAGLVECSGFLSETQTSYAEAWATKPGAAGEPAALNGLQIRLVYLSGFFEGLDKKYKGPGAGVLRASDVVHGNFNTAVCGCVRLVAEGKVPKLKGTLITRLEVCPES